MVSTFMTKVHAGLQNTKARWQRASPEAAITTQNILLGPYNTGGHKGDLPVLVVGADGDASLPVLAPQLRVKDVRGRSLMIHEGGDNYSDQPEPLGGGGTRIACGVIK